MRENVLMLKHAELRGKVRTVKFPPPSQTLGEGGYTPVGDTEAESLMGPANATK